MLDMGANDGLPHIPFASAAEWERWLEGNHDLADGVWIKMAKTASGIASVRHTEAVEVALCFGWIEGVARRSTIATSCSGSRHGARAATGPGSTAGGSSG
jgi:uncharacterized protein YdeI (YjbR/CyaY-like superfamily)